MMLKIFFFVMLIAGFETSIVASSKDNDLVERDCKSLLDEDLSSIFLTAPLSFSRVTFSSFESGLKQAKLPSSLRVEFSDIGDAGAKLVANSRALGGVTDLTLDRCHITSIGIEHLMKGRFVCDLSSLSLCGNPIKDNGVKFLSAQGEAPFFKKLKILNLMRCGLTVDGIGSLLSGGIYTHEFRRFWLSGNEIGDKGAYALAEGLSSGKFLYLESLGIANCGITKKGFLAIAEAILHQKTVIQSIFMARNPVDFKDDGVFAALEQLKEHGHTGVSVFWIKDGRSVSNFD